MLLGLGSSVMRNKVDDTALWVEIGSWGARKEPRHVPRSGMQEQYTQYGELDAI